MNLQSTLSFRIRKVPGVVSTDDIIPGRYKHMFTDAGELAKHVFENYLPGFAATVQPGDAIHCADTFGIGSSREQAVSSLLAAGITCVLAPRFGRIFFRNAWNLGLIALDVPSVPLAEGDRVTVHLTQGRLIWPSGMASFKIPSQQMLRMVESGGLLELVRQRLQRAAASTKPGSAMGGTS